MAFIEAIFTAPAAAQPLVRQARVFARAGVGLAGDRYAAGTGYWRDNKVSRDLTLIEAEAIEALNAELGIVLPFESFRRNVITRGVRLNELVGVRARLGSVVIEGTSLCEPCEYLARLVGAPILQPLVRRGGLRAKVLIEGELAERAPIDVLRI